MQDARPEAPVPQPFQLKNLFSRDFLEKIASTVTAVYPTFKEARFLQMVFDEHWQHLELKQRMRHISNSLRVTLPSDYAVAVAILVQAVERLLAQGGERLAFEWCVWADFVEAHGTEFPDHSLPALEVMTQMGSAEFAIRPFLLHHFERTAEQMLRWAQHESPLVRRLASEGFRPRLPWGMGIPSLKKDPTPILPILEMLKNDPAETVRRSVANNLNDISKEHPQLVLELAARWLGQSPETDAVVRHACRGLLKKGDTTALALFGFERGAAGIEVLDFSADTAVTKGGVLHFSFALKNAASVAQKIRLEYAIHYLTATGGISKKVFQIKSIEYAAGATEKIARKQRFQDFTTRKHYAGQHQLHLLANGEVLASQTFWLLDDSNL